MKSKVTTTAGLMFGLFFILFIGDSCELNQTEDVIRTPDAQLAAFHTDQYVWEKMVEAFRVRQEEPFNLEWELWSSSSYAYQNPCDPVKWPVGSQIDSILKHPKVSSFANFSGNIAVTEFAILTVNLNPYYEELRINRAMFDYIQEAGLYNQNTVYQMAKEGKINFPPEAMMIKAQWIPVKEEEAKAYYTKMGRIKKLDLEGKDSTTTDTKAGDSENSEKDGTYETVLLGLVGFHLVTHELPNWVWSTFEYVGNPGLCDHIGCKDEFGCVPSYIPPNELLNQGYEGYQKHGVVSKALNDLYEKNGIPDVFRNYRLKGSQTEYTDNTGDTLILGNSILEMNLVPSSSCISCHARATLNNAPDKRQRLGMFLPDTWGDSFEFLNTGETTRGWHPTCYTGTPVIADYLNAGAGGEIDEDLVYYQTNFMWQLSQDTEPCPKDE